MRSPLKVLQVIGARLRRLVGIIEELSFTRVRHRLMSSILRQAKTGASRFALGTRHQELAAQIGTVRELVSRNLVGLQAQGFIDISGRELSVLEPAGLEVELTSFWEDLCDFGQCADRCLVVMWNHRSDE